MMRLIRTAHHGTRFPALAKDGEDVQIGEVVEVAPAVASTLLARGFEPYDGDPEPEPEPEAELAADMIDEDEEDDFEE